MKHTTEKHMVNFDRNMFAWRKALDACVDDFAETMKQKLHKKAMEGKDGWDNPEWPIEEIISQLCSHITKGDMVDVAAFAMFAWNKADGAIVKTKTSKLPATVEEIIIAAVGNETHPASGNATIREVIEGYLKENDYDGLFYPGECACLMNECGLFPCESCFSECQPGYKHDDPDGVFDYIVSSEPPQETLIGTDRETGAEITD